MAILGPSAAPLVFTPPFLRLAFWRAAFGFILAALGGGGIGGRGREVAVSSVEGDISYKGLVLSFIGIEL